METIRQNSAIHRYLSALGVPHQSDMKNFERDREDDEMMIDDSISEEDTYEVVYASSDEDHSELDTEEAVCQREEEQIRRDDQQSRNNSKSSGRRQSNTRKSELVDLVRCCGQQNTQHVSPGKNVARNFPLTTEERQYFNNVSSQNPIINPSYQSQHDLALTEDPRDPLETPIPSLPNSKTLVTSNQRSQLPPRVMVKSEQMEGSCRAIRQGNVRNNRGNGMAEERYSSALSNLVTNNKEEKLVRGNRSRRNSWGYSEKDSGAKLCHQKNSNHHSASRPPFSPPTLDLPDMPSDNCSMNKSTRTIQQCNVHSNFTPIKRCDREETSPVNKQTRHVLQPKVATSQRRYDRNSICSSNFHRLAFPDSIKEKNESAAIFSNPINASHHPKNSTLLVHRPVPKIGRRKNSGSVSDDPTVEEPYMIEQSNNFAQSKMQHSGRQRRVSSSVKALVSALEVPAKVQSRSPLLDLCEEIALTKKRESEIATMQKRESEIASRQQKEKENHQHNQKFVENEASEVKNAGGENKEPPSMVAAAAAKAASEFVKAATATKPTNIGVYIESIDEVVTSTKILRKSLTSSRRKKLRNRRRSENIVSTTHTDSIVRHTDRARHTDSTRHTDGIRYTDSTRHTDEMENMNEVIKNRLSIYTKKAEAASASELQAMEKRQMKKIEDGFFPVLNEMEVRLEAKLDNRMHQLDAYRETFDRKLDKLEAKIEHKLAERMDRFEKKIEGTVQEIYNILTQIVHQNRQ